MSEKKTEISDEKQKLHEERPWLFKPGQSGNPNGKPKGTFSLKTFAKNYLKNLTDEEKLKFLEGLPKEIVWKMAEGNPATNGGEEDDGTPKPILVKFIDGNDRDSN